MDKIVINLDTDQRECVACGFAEARPGYDAPTAAGNKGMASGSVGELPTRVNRPAARRVETPAEPVRLLEPKAETKTDKGGKPGP
jgi:hypothetical protein